MLEHEWPRWIPDDILFPVARVRMTSPDAEGYAQMADDAPAAAHDLATAGVDLVAYACTLGSLFAGSEAEDALIASLQLASGKPAISLAATSVLALRTVGAGRIAIMTPYADAQNQWVADYAVIAGFEVAGFIPTPLDIRTVGSMPPAEVAEVAIRGLAQLPEADALWIPCTAIQTMDMIASLESITNLPVVSGTQALLWHSLQLLGTADRITNAGCLFAQLNRS